MKFFSQNNFRILNRCRFTFSLFLVLLLVFNAVGQIRDIEISSFLEPSRSRPTVNRFISSGRFMRAGGVVPYGTAEFYSPPAKAKITPAQLKLIILDKTKLQNDEPDYGAIGIKWGRNVYPLAAQDDLIYPLMKFIQRDSFIAFTIRPSSAFDNNSVRTEGLEFVASGPKDSRIYVAKEFNSRPHIEFLFQVDTIPPEELKALPENVEESILNNVNAQLTRLGGASGGTYLNADFHVKYQVFLDNRKRIAEVGGLPLRYHWGSIENLGTAFYKAEVFPFPKEQFDLHYRAVLFFQTAAILRQFRTSNNQEFIRFMREVETVIRSR